MNFGRLGKVTESIEVGASKQQHKYKYKSKKNRDPHVLCTACKQPFYPVSHRHKVCKGCRLPYWVGYKNGRSNCFSEFTNEIKEVLDILIEDE